MWTGDLANQRQWLSPRDRLPLRVTFRAVDNTGRDCRPLREHLMSRFAPLGLPGGRDLVDEAVVERLARVEIAPTARVLRDLLGGPARAPGEASVELPQQLLLLATLRGDLLRGAGKPRRRLGEVEPRVRHGGAVIGSRDHADGWAADLTPAKDAQRRAQRVRRVDYDADRPERAGGAVQVNLDRPVPVGVQR